MPASFDKYAIFLNVLIIAALSLYYIIHKKRISAARRKISSMGSKGKIYYSAHYSISFDYTRKRIIYFKVMPLKVGPILTFPANDILKHYVDANSEPDAQGVLRQKSWTVSIVPASPDRETLRFEFASYLETREFLDALDQLNQLASAIENNRTQSPKRLIPKRKGAAIADLTNYLAGNGFPPAKSADEVSKTRVADAVALMCQKYEEVTGHSLPGATPVGIMGPALEPIFGQSDERPFGFKPGYLRNLVSTYSPMKKRRKTP